MDIVYDTKKMWVTFPAEADESDFVMTPPPAGMRIDFERQWRLDAGQWRALLIPELREDCRL